MMCEAGEDGWSDNESDSSTFANRGDFSEDWSAGESWPGSTDGSDVASGGDFDDETDYETSASRNVWKCDDEYSDCDDTVICQRGWRFEGEGECYCPDCEAEAEADWRPPVAAWEASDSVYEEDRHNRKPRRSRRVGTTKQQQKEKHPPPPPPLSRPPPPPPAPCPSFGYGGDEQHETAKQVEASNSPAQPKTNVGKRMFQLAAEIFSSTPRALYLEYLRKGCDTKIPFKTVSETATSSDKYFDSCFRTSDPKAAPKYFNAMDFSDLAKFERSILPEGDTLVVLMEKKYAKSKKTSSKYYKLYDGRYQALLIREANVKRANCTILCVDKDTKEVRLVPKKDQEHFKLFRRCAESHIFGELEKLPHHQTPGAAISTLLTSPIEGTVADIIAASPDLDPPRHLLVVSHRNTLSKRALRDLLKPKSNDFSYLALLKKRGSKGDIWEEGVDVALLTPSFLSNGKHGFKIFTLDSEWAESIWTGYKFSGKRAGGGPTECHLTEALLQMVATSTKTKREKARDRREATRAARKQRKSEIQRKMEFAEAAYSNDDIIASYWDNPGGEEEEEEEVESELKRKRHSYFSEADYEDEMRCADLEAEAILFDNCKLPPTSCGCDDCLDCSELYGKSVRPWGPQIRQDCQPDTFEYLKIFGLHTEANVALVTRALGLSVAAFDIEATTEFLHEEGSDGIPFEPVSKVAAPTGKVAVQRACKIGHGDSFGDSETFTYREFEQGSVGDSQAEMIAEWYEYMRIRRKKLAEQKTLILKPILDHLGLLLKEMRVYYEGRLAAETGDGGDEEEWTAQIDPDSALKNSLPGKFLLHLNKKIQELRVFSFNGTSYDHVLVSKTKTKFYIHLKKVPKFYRSL